MTYEGECCTTGLTEAELAALNAAYEEEVLANEEKDWGLVDPLDDVYRPELAD